MGLGTVQGADWGILNKYYENAIANICEELVVCNCDFRPHLELFLLIGLSNVLIRMSQRLMEERLSQRAPLQHSTPFTFSFHRYFQFFKHKNIFDVPQNWWRGMNCFIST